MAIMRCPEGMLAETKIETREDGVMDGTVCNGAGSGDHKLAVYFI